MASKLSTMLDQIDSGVIALPEFQRGYVWNRDQVRKLMRSLYRGYPVGGLLMWETKTEPTNVRGDGTLAAGVVKLLLDGQQRITSLYGIVRGKPPKFFDGNEQAFKGLFFNLEMEEFEFYAPLKMKDNPLWIDVTRLMQQNIAPFLAPITGHPQYNDFINRMLTIYNIQQREFNVDTVTGEDKTVDAVVDIFNEVNSGGTKLSKGDLALAKVCASWSDARDEMKVRLSKWKHYGFNFKLDWLMRCITTTLTGDAYFTALKDVNAQEFAEGLQATEKHVDTTLNLISARLGLDHDRVLGSRYTFPLITRYLAMRGKNTPNHRERDKLLYWYIHTFLWGRYAGSTESTLSQDLAAIKSLDGALDRLIANLRQDRGDLKIYPRDFEGWSTSNRFYPMLYMLTRVWHAKDLDSGIDLTAHMLGRLNTLQVHHIFPRALLYKHGYSKSMVNAVANFTFLTQETNLRISDHNPSKYLEEFASKNPGAVESHWIPMDTELWKIENFAGFLAERRKLLAKAANDFLGSLLSGNIPETQETPSVLEHETSFIPGSVDSDIEESILQDCNIWVQNEGLAEGEYQFELTDKATGQALAILDIAWELGVQPQKTQPVALLLNEEADVLRIAQQQGYRCFTEVDDFKHYVRDEVLNLIPVTG